MAGIATHLLEFPPEGQLTDAQYDKRINSFWDSLEKLDSGKVLKADLQQDFLQILDPRINSLSYNYVLSIRYRALTATKNPSLNEARTILLQALSLLQQYDPIQMRYAGSMFRSLIDMAFSIASHLQQVRLKCSEAANNILLIAANSSVK